MDPTVLGGCYQTVNFSFRNSTVRVFLVSFGFKASTISHLCAVSPAAVPCFPWLRLLNRDTRKGLRRRKTVSTTLVIFMIAAGFSSRRPGFHTMIVCMVFVVDKVAREHTRTWVFLNNSHFINAPYSFSYHTKPVQLVVSARQGKVPLLQVMKAQRKSTLPLISALVGEQAVNATPWPVPTVQKAVSYGWSVWTSAGNLASPPSL
jgi:hypothetical protein